MGRVGLEAPTRRVTRGADSMSGSLGRRARSAGSARGMGGRCGMTRVEMSKGVRGGGRTYSWCNLRSLGCSSRVMQDAGP